MHVHIYATQYTGQEQSAPEAVPGHPDFAGSPMQPRNVWDWLRRPVDRIAATVETPELAADWHATWREDFPRPESFWNDHFTPDLDIVATVRLLTKGIPRVDGWYGTGGVRTIASFIPCPADGEGYGCPEGRADSPTGSAGVWR